MENTLYNYYSYEKTNPFNTEEQVFAFLFWKYEQKFDKLFYLGDFSPELWHIDDSDEVVEWNFVVNKGSVVDKESLFKIWLYNLLANYLPNNEVFVGYDIIREEYFTESKKHISLKAKQPQFASKKQHREYLLSKCKYYEKHDSSPSFEGLKCYEEHWLEEKLNSRYELYRIVEYSTCDLTDFSIEDGVPFSLKALLFNRFMHWGGGYGTPDSFKKWYKESYLK